MPQLARRDLLKIGAVTSLLAALPAAARAGDPASASPVAADDQAAAWHAAALRHRTRRAAVTLRGPTGPLPAGTVVDARLERHAFRFGVNIHAFGLVRPEAQRALEAAVAGLASAVTVPCYWGQSLYGWLPPYEAERGVRRNEAFRAAAGWARQRGLWVKGHPLIFFREPAWVQRLDEAGQEAAYWAHVRDTVAANRDLVQAWEVVNEPTKGPGEAAAKGAVALAGLCARRGVASVIARAHAEAAAADPAAQLIVNDWVEDESFVRVLRDAQAAGARLDAIGVQHHEEHPHSVASRQAMLDRFAALGRPVHLTELMIPSCSDAERKGFCWKPVSWASTPEGEARQSEEAVRIYRQAFAHPAAGGVTWWDVLDERACLGMTNGLLRADLTPKPVYEALRRLVREEWASRCRMTAGPAGAELTGFAGTYRLTAEIDGRHLTATVELTDDQRPATAVFA
jgi:endo-1,4-beta-xylanase